MNPIAITFGLDEAHVGEDDRLTTLDTSTLPGTLSHEQYKSRLGRIVEVTTEEAAIEIASLGSLRPLT